VIALALLTLGCRPSNTPEDTAAAERPLVSVSGWITIDDAADPLGAERPDEVDCPSWGFLEEYGSFEVNTDVCNYGAFSQPLLTDISAGDTLLADLWYDTLWAPEPAQAHVAFGIDGELLWERWIDIPSDASSLRAEVTAAVDYPEGTPVWLHVHNHGGNTYNFMPLTTAP